MIKFFRRIRQKLLSENKFSKYLIYALGEIVLVVIGILIALQINNWNLTQQDRNTEKQNLLALQEEFSKNKATLQEIIELNNENISSAEKMIQSFSKSTKDTITELSIANYTSETFGIEINFEPETGVLTEIISSGQLKLIQNKRLKHKLAGLQSKIDEIKQQENEVIDYRLMAIKQMINEANMERVYTHIGFRKTYVNTDFDNTGIKSMLNSMPFLNLIVLYQSSSIITNESFYDPLNQEIDIILELIANRLKEL
ncbi:DUF6090 family protein [Croceivirga thetidis]|uniref:Uncharacterized protein n=1 Tax=Croceivirga thetidis TaxID=2721623 RepID=A0ABX1GL96_9FLAO|nr:DUF6090 family protein [Croceivirga thetidis]NKI30423.1 hypothetical protein [Croceivirga thetidis]